MAFRFIVILLATAFVWTAPAAAVKELVITDKISIQRSELSISRLRVYLAPRINKQICRTHANVLRSGGIVRYDLVGAGDILITSFRVTKDKCK